MLADGLLIDIDLQIVDGRKPLNTKILPLPDALKSTTGEQAIQDSLSRHTEYLPFPVNFHHRNWFRWVVSKYELPSGNITDFAYITTTSAKNTVVLIEIEDPAKQMWTGTAQKPSKSAAFNKAIEQVTRWRTDLNKPEQMSALVADFKAMMGTCGLQVNNWYVEYALVFGRSADNNTQARRDAYADLQAKAGIHLMTFDHLVENVKNLGAQERHNVVKISRPGPTFSYLYLNRDPKSEFAYLEPGRLILDDQIERVLKAKGFDIDAWKKGNLLVVNNKHPSEDLPLMIEDYLRSLNNAK